ncbi:hypothetical protein [Paraburkholderia jirisanensis]
MNGSRFASSTDLPSTSAAIVTDIDVCSERPVPSVVKLRISATICRITKKNTVGGSISKNSCLIVAVSLLMIVSALC